MKQVRRTTLVSAIAAAATTFAAAPVAQAVMLYRTPTRNTAPPDGVFANSGWQYQGQWTGFLGTPISSKFFISAKHVGGHSGVPFTYNSVNYSIDATFNGGSGFSDIPGTDLRIWKIAQTFPTWAPLYDAAVDGPETGKQLAVFGRGTQRGDPVYGRYPSPPRDGGNGGTFGDFPIPNPNQVGELKGWSFGTDDRVQSWGTNIVTGTLHAGPDFGTVVYYDFDRNGLFDESALSNGDSGGGMFIQGAGGVWKLAGVNFSVDGPWRVTLESPTIFAGLFDAGGVWIMSDPPQLVPDGSADIPGSSYSSSISANLAAINAVISAGAASAPEPGSAALLVAAGAIALRRRGRR